TPDGSLQQPGEQEIGGAEGLALLGVAQARYLRASEGAGPWNLPSGRQTVKMQHRSRAHASRSDALTPGATTYSRPRIRRGAPAAAVALGLSLACPPALAAPLPPPPDPRAEEDVQPLLTRAIALFDDRQFDEAIALFE